MEQLIILNFSNPSVHIYNVEPKVEVNEEYISNLGYHPSECSWMTHSNMKIEFHNEILDGRYMEE